MDFTQADFEAYMSGYRLLSNISELAKLLEELPIEDFVSVFEHLYSRINIICKPSFKDLMEIDVGNLANWIISIGTDCGNEEIRKFLLEIKG